jgi:hypothetical protein
MKAYMGWDGEIGSEEGALLIFVHSIKEAKKIGGPIIRGWFDGEFIDTRIKWLKDKPHLFKDNADPAKLKADIAHVVESPRSCIRCELWGLPINEDGICEECESSEAEDWRHDLKTITIRGWLKKATKMGATHLFVCVDVLDYDDNYPIFVMPEQNVRKVAEETDIGFQRIMEVYSLALDTEKQLTEKRAFHWD